MGSDEQVYRFVSLGSVENLSDADAGTAYFPFVSLDMGSRKNVAPTRSVTRIDGCRKFCTETDLSMTVSCNDNRQICMDFGVQPGARWQLRPGKSITIRQPFPTE